MGWNGSRTGKSPARAVVDGPVTRFAPKWVFAGAAVLLLAAGGALWLWLAVGGGEGQPSAPVRVRAKPRRIGEAKPAAAPRAATNAAPAQVRREPAAERPAAKNEPEMEPTILKSEVVEEGLIICEVPSNMPSHLRNPYRTQVESLLSMLGKPGTPYTPVPIDPKMDMEEDFLKAMENTIVIWEDETEQSAQRKQMVNWMKNAVAEARKEGWKVGDLLKALEQERKHQWDMLSKAQAMLSETEETMPEHMTEVREALNRELDAAGVEPIEKRDVEDEVPQQEFSPVNKNEAQQEDTQQ